jgi:hypothetical protein
MKVFLENDIKLPDCKPTIEKIIYFLSYDGVYKKTNKKIIKYNLINSDKSKKISLPIGDIFISYDSLKYVAETNHIPNDSKEIRKTIYKYNVNQDFSVYVEETSTYIETNYNIDSDVFKKCLYSLIIS